MCFIKMVANNPRFKDKKIFMNGLNCLRNVKIVLNMVSPSEIVQLNCYI